jgi:hypothetical protein
MEMSLTSDTQRKGWLIPIEIYPIGMSFKPLECYRKEVNELLLNILESPAMLKFNPRSAVHDSEALLLQTLDAQQIRDSQVRKFIVKSSASYVITLFLV